MEKLTAFIVAGWLLGVGAAAHSVPADALPLVRELGLTQ